MRDIHIQNLPEGRTTRYGWYKEMRDIHIQNLPEGRTTSSISLERL
jgi:hypothetical protein